MATNLLPVAMLMSVPRARRRALMPLALPAVANVPAAQAGALAVVSADAELRRRDARANAAITTTIETAVAREAKFQHGDLSGVPIVADIVSARPDILGIPIEVAAGETVTRADVAAMLKLMADNTAAVTQLANALGSTSGSGTATAKQAGTTGGGR